MTALVLPLPLAQIHVPARRLRDFDPAGAAQLAAAIAAQGLLQPIVVRPRPRGGWWLVTGLYRLRAVEALRHVTIMALAIETADEAAAIQAEAAENLARVDLLPLDRCRALAELKALYEAAHPEARHGGDRRSEAARAEREAREGSTCQVGNLIGDAGDNAQGSVFAREIGQQSGMSWRAVLRCTAIWEGLSPASRRRLVGTPWAANQSELQLLSEQPHAAQAAILDVLLDPCTTADTVRAAMEHLEGLAPLKPAERRFQAYCDGFAKLTEPQVDHFLSLHHAAILESLGRRGELP